MKLYRCFVCNQYVAKNESAPLYNSESLRNFCRSHVDDYQEDHKYFWDEKKGELVRGYTSDELYEMKMAKMSPEERTRYKARRRHTAQIAISSVLAMIIPDRPDFFDRPVVKGGWHNDEDKKDPSPTS